jgi:hypothetical protein
VLQGAQAAVRADKREPNGGDPAPRPSNPVQEALLEPPPMRDAVLVGAVISGSGGFFGGGGCHDCSACSRRGGNDVPSTLNA